MAPFGNFGDRHDEDIPSGEFVSQGWIGEAVTKRLWDLGWNANKEFEDTAGHKLPEGKVYITGTKEEAETYLKTNAFNNNKFVNSVVVTTMSLASVTNLTQDQLSKFVYPIQMAVPYNGLGKDYTQVKFVGFGLVVVPSMVDAYARMSGWYKDSLFDLSLFTSSLEHVTDAKDLIDHLASQRARIWTALGEENWKAGAKDASGKKLKDALNVTTLQDWKQFCRLHSVFDPSHGAGYTSKKDNSFTRQRVQIISEFYPGEREAVAAGKAEIEAKGGAQSPNGTTASVYAQLSEKTRKNYDEETWRVTAPDIIAALKAGTAKPKLMKDYSVTMPDLALLEG